MLPAQVVRAVDRCDLPTPPRRVGSVPDRSLATTPPPPSRLVSRETPPAESITTSPDALAAPNSLPQIPALSGKTVPQNIPSEETQRRIERLQRQIEELGDRLSSPVSEPAFPVPSEPPVDAVPPPENDVPEVHQNDHQESSREAHEAAAAPLPKVSHEPHAQAAANPSNKKPKTLIKDLPVAPQDRIAVGDNLFAAGETVLANEVYRQVPIKQLTRDEAAWVDFQIANCERRLGKIDDAKKRYRRLVADPTIAWQELAKWWLDALDEQETLKKEHERLEVVIREIEKATHDDNPESSGQ